MLHVTSINGGHCLPPSGRGITPFHALKLWPLQCAKGAHGYGLPCVPDAIGAIDRANAGLRRKAKAWEREQGRMREMGRGKQRESAAGMHPQGACLGLGQGYRNAPLEIPMKARAGLEECSSRAPTTTTTTTGSRMAADQVSVWGSASCRQGFWLPWGEDRRLKA